MFGSRKNVPDLRDTRNNNRFAKARDQKAFDYLETHAATAKQLVAAGLYDTPEKAIERMNIGVKRGQVSYVCHVRNEDNLWEKLFARWAVPKPNGQHEYEITHLIQKRGMTNITRGYFVDDMFADCEGDIDGVRYYLERDRNNEGYAELLKKLFRYESTNTPVLWVLNSQTRIKGLLKILKDREIKKQDHWFATFEDAISQEDDVWVGLSPDA